MASSDTMFKVCLVNPPVLGVLEPWYDTPSFCRTGLAYLAGYLRQFAGFEISILDCKFERLNFEQALAKIQKLNPDVVGFTAFTNEIKPAAYLAAKVKQAQPQAAMVIGGVHVTALPKETLSEFKSFDIGVVGEGEITFHELCHALRSNASTATVRGIVFRASDEIIQTQQRERVLDQDSIPFPAWDLLPKAETYFVQSIRGCPFNCLFCMNPNGKIARKRSVANVMEELNYIIKEFAPKRISFGDELFSVDKKRTHELLDAMIAADIGSKVEWDVQTHVDYVDYELFLKFRQARVARVELGVETGDEQALRRMGKGTDLKAIYTACAAARKAGVTFGTFLLIGQPDETPESIRKTIDIAVKVNPDLPMFGLMTPYPGTEVARMAARGEGGYKLLTTDWDEYNKQIGGAMEFANLSRKQIEWLQIIGYAKVFLFNFRFYDFAVFLWDYRKGAFEVLKKILINKNKMSHLLNKPHDYDAVLAKGAPSTIASLVTAREDWQRVQRNELKAAKSANPELLAE